MKTELPPSSILPNRNPYIQESRASFYYKTKTGNGIDGSMPSWGKRDLPSEVISESIQKESSILKNENSTALFLNPQHDNPREETGFGFADLIDLVNPLQHIPLVSNLYRSLTGDEIKSSSQIIGGTLFGGFAGAISGIANAIAINETGRDIGGNLIDIIKSDTYTESDSNTVIAVSNLSLMPSYNE